MAKKKSARNKTIDLSLKEGAEYLDRCISIDQKVELSDVLDKTIIGDTFLVLNKLPRESIDLLIADPPYNMSKSFHGNVFTKKTREDYERYTRSWLELALPLLKKDGTMYICCDYLTSVSVANVLSEFSDLLIVRNRISWQREKGRGAKANWKNSMEDIWYATKSDDYTFNLADVMLRRQVVAPYRQDGKPKDWDETERGNFRDTHPSNFWDDITIPFWSMAENTAHPTQKPEKLLAKLILASSNKADVVLDPFLGSGSTSVAAKKLGRHYIGIEINPLYCLWAEKRLENAKINPSIQGYVDNVFWERNTLGQQRRAKKES